MDFDEQIRSAGDDLVIAYFWGPDCPNCQVFAGHLPGIQEQLKNDPVRWVKVNAYEEQALATRYGLHGIPTFLLFKRGKLLGRMTSFQGDEFFLAVIRQQLSF